MTPFKLKHGDKTHFITKGNTFFHQDGEECVLITDDGTRMPYFSNMDRTSFFYAHIDSITPR